jgi:hypothetical protein
MAKMTPSEYADKYLNLDVYLYPQELSAAAAKEPPGYSPVEGWKRLRADNYRLGQSDWRNQFWDNDIIPHFQGKPFEIQVQTIEGARETMPVMDATKANEHYRIPFVGKGSPEQLQFATQLVYRFRHVVTPVEQFVAAPAGSSASTATGSSAPTSSGWLWGRSGRKAASRTRPGRTRTCPFSTASRTLPPRSQR